MMLFSHHMVLKVCRIVLESDAFASSVAALLYSVG